MLAIIVVMTISLNGKLLYHLNKKKRSSRLYLLTSCSISDLLQAGVGYVLQIILTNVSRSSHTWTQQCLAVSFVVTFFGLASISHLTFMALDRSIHIGNPMLAMRLLDMNNGGWRTFVAIAWIMSFIAAVLPFLGFGSFDIRSNSISCSVSWQDRRSSSVAYIYILITVFFIIPVLIFVTLMIHDVYRLSENRATFKYLYSGQSPIVMKQRRSSCKKKAFRHFRMVQLMIGVFILQWTPYVVNTLIIHATSKKIHVWLDLAANMLAKASTVSNPVIYLIWEKRGARNTGGSLELRSSTKSKQSIRL